MHLDEQLHRKRRGHVQICMCFKISVSSSGISEQGEVALGLKHTAYLQVRSQAPFRLSCAHYVPLLTHARLVPE